MDKCGDIKRMGISIQVATTLPGSKKSHGSHTKCKRLITRKLPANDLNIKFIFLEYIKKYEVTISQTIVYHKEHRIAIHSHKLDLIF